MNHSITPFLIMDIHLQTYKLMRLHNQQHCQSIAIEFCFGGENKKKFTFWRFFFCFAKGTYPLENHLIFKFKAMEIWLQKFAFKTFLLFLRLYFPFSYFSASLSFCFRYIIIVNMTRIRMLLRRRDALFLTNINIFWSNTKFFFHLFCSKWNMWTM